MSHVQVRAVKLRRERVVVALEHKVLVYDFKDLKLLHSIETLSNPMGLVALSPSQDQTVMACPGLHCGQVCLVHVQRIHAAYNVQMQITCMLGQPARSWMLQVRVWDFPRDIASSPRLCMLQEGSAMSRPCVLQPREHGRSRHIHPCCKCMQHPCSHTRPDVA